MSPFFSNRTAAKRARLTVEQLEGRLTTAWAGVPPATVNPTGALAITLNNQGDAGGSGYNYYGENDYLSLTAPTTGSYKITASASGRSRMDTVVGLFDAN